MEYFAWLEETAFSTWLRESSWALFALLIVHTLALGLVVGVNMLIALRVLGMGRAIAFDKFELFYPPACWALLVVLVSGVLLLLAYPAKALTNWVFYFKLVCVVTALIFFWRFKRLMHSSTVSEPSKSIALAVIVLWFAAVGAGRFLAYTHSVLLASFYT